MGGGGAALVSNPFSQVLMGGRGVEGVDVGRRRGSGAQPCFIYPGVSAHSAARLSPLVPANGSDPAGVRRRALESSVLHFGSPPSARREFFSQVSINKPVTVAPGCRRRHRVEVRRTEENGRRAVRGSAVCERQFSTLVITRL